MPSAAFHVLNPRKGALHVASKIPAVHFCYRAFQGYPLLSVTLIVLGGACLGLMFPTAKQQRTKRYKVELGRRHDLDLHYRDGDIPANPKLERWRLNNLWRVNAPDHRPYDFPEFDK